MREQKPFEFIYVHPTQHGPMDILINAVADINNWDFKVDGVDLDDITYEGKSGLYDLILGINPELLATIQEVALQRAREVFEEPSEDEYHNSYNEDDAQQDTEQKDFTYREWSGGKR